MTRNTTQPMAIMTMVQVVHTTSSSSNSPLTKTEKKEMEMITFKRKNVSTEVILAKSDDIKEK